MSNSRVTIKEFLTLPLTEQVGDGNDSYGAWYDWFCANKALVVRGKSLVSKLKSIQHSPKFNTETSYVFFKNNCPCCGSLYDDFRICDIETGDVLFTIVPKEGYTQSTGEGCVWGNDNDGKFGELFRGTWKEIKCWFNEK